MARPRLFALLSAYEAERSDVVISRDRLTRTVKRLRQALSDCTIKDQRTVAELVAGYVERRREAGVADATIARELISLRAALRQAWKAGLLPFQPYVAMPSSAKTRQRFLTRHEAKPLLKAADPRIELFIRLALATGARRGAILDLTWDRVDFDRELIDFRAPDPRASRRKHRAVVPMSERLLAILTRARRRSRDERVVPLTPSVVERLIRRAAESAGLTDVTAHTLRHTAATWMLTEGKVPLLLASAMLGHRSTVITEQVYTHLAAEHLRETAELLDAMLA